MKILLLITLTLNILFAQDFYAVVKPFNAYNIKASVSGNVIKVYENLEGTYIKNSTIVQLDDVVDKIDLKESKLKLENLKEVLKLEQDTLNSFNKVSSKSKIDKNNQKIKVLNISSSVSDLVTKIATLEDKITKKDIKVSNLYISNIAVKKGDWVNLGSLLFTADDLSKGKIDIFIPISNNADIKNKTIYIDGKKTNLKISKLYKVADNKNISSFKCEIILDKNPQFSKVVKVTFK
jgi:hypothetical protein